MQRPCRAFSGVPQRNPSAFWNLVDLSVLIFGPIPFRTVHTSADERLGHPIRAYSTYPFRAFSFIAHSWE